MPESSYLHPLFGLVRFRTDNSEWRRGDGITFLSGFDLADVTEVVIPQLENVPGSASGKLRFHKLGRSQILSAFAEVEVQGLLPHVKTCAGTLSLRLRKPTSGALSKLPSNHAFGIAIDMNENDRGFGESISPIAPIFQSHGFKWGAEFNDPMHFEVMTFHS